jgi:hypothetical protein
MDDESTSRTDRVKVRVFLACSRDMHEHRKAFGAIVERIGARPNFSRHFELQPVTWEGAGGPVDEKGKVQEAIFKHAGFDSAQVVVMLCGTRVGPGTLAEFDQAVDLKRRHGEWPRLLMFFKADADGVTLAGGPDMERFRSDVFENGVTVPTNFRDDAELESKLATQLEAILFEKPLVNPEDAVAARRTFLATSAMIGALSVLTVSVSQTMAFPDNDVRYWKVLLILIAPPLLFLLGAIGLWRFRRGVLAFRAAWVSPQYTNDQIFAHFANFVPSFAWPKSLRSGQRDLALGTVLVTLLLGVTFVLPPVVQHGCLFGELLEWDFVISPEVLAADSVAPEASSGEPRLVPVLSRYVERHPLHFPYVAKDPAFRERQATGAVVYVYAPGYLGDGSKFGEADAYRENLGPEVFLPWQPLIYGVLWVVQIGFAGYVLYLLVRLRTGK